VVIVFWVFGARNYGAVDHRDTSRLPVAFTAAAVKQRAFTTTELQHVAWLAYTVVHIQCIEEFGTSH